MTQTTTTPASKPKGRALAKPQAPASARTPEDIARLALLPSVNSACVIEAYQGNILGKDGDINVMIDRLRETFKEAKTKSLPLSLIVFDVDDFKSYNDMYGHQAGDKALELISSISKTVIRRMDNLARYGGEEFVAILPGTTKPEAMKLAERLRETIERDSTAALSNGMPNKVTVSIGVASFPEDADDKDKLIFCADGALYEAKRAGKNRVRAYRKT